jgi:hypothetical protein
MALVVELAGHDRKMFRVERAIAYSGHQTSTFANCRKKGVRVSRIKSAVIRLLALVCIVAFPSVGNATVRYWFNWTANWDSPIPWGATGMPVNGDVAVLYCDVDSTATRSSTAVPIVAPGLDQLEVEGLDGSTMTLALDGSQLYATDQFIGIDGKAMVLHGNSINRVGSSLVLGFQGTSVGTYQMSGGSLTVGDGIVLGYSGASTGVFTQDSGAVSATGIWIGNGQFAKGTYTLASFATLDVGSLLVGVDGAGTFSGAGTLSVAHDVWIGADPTGVGVMKSQGFPTEVAGDTYIATATGSTGTLEILGSYISHGNVVVGAKGYLSSFDNRLQLDPGRVLSIEGGTASFSSTAIRGGIHMQVISGGSVEFSDTLDVASSPSGGGNTGTLVVDGTNSRIAVSNFSDTSYWAREAGDSARIYASNNGSILLNSRLSLAALGGSAFVQVSTGARIAVRKDVIAGGSENSSVVLQVNGGNLHVGDGTLSTGTTVNIDGGSFSYASLMVKPGAIVNFNTGSFQASDSGPTYVANFAGGSGLFASAFSIRNLGSFSVTQGGTVDSTKAFNVAQSNNGKNTFTVTGANSRLRAGLSGDIADVSQWGQGTNSFATVSFSNNGAGTFAAGVGIASVGKALIDVASGARLYIEKSLNTGGASTSFATLTINGGTLTSSDLTRLGLNTDVTVSTGALRLQNASTIELGATLRWNGGTLELQNTTVGGNILLSSGNNKVFRATSLDVTTTGKIDLSDNPMILDYSGSSPAQSIRQALQRGRSAVPTNGLTSSFVAADLLHRALGYIESSTLLGPTGGTFANQNVDGTALLIKYALPGDTDLNGTVDAVDLGKLALHWSSTGLWIDGDFDYSGSIDVRDLYLLASNWKSTLPGAPAPALSPDLDLLLTSFGLPPAQGPEPTAAAALLALGACALRRRR